MKYTVIWMTYNQKHLLGDYLKSLDNQTYEGELEVIISDDGSTDGTKEAAQEMGWLVCGNKVNKGFDIITGANQAALIAKGEYLIYFTGDTYPHKEFIEQLDKHVAPNRLLNGLRLQTDKQTRKVIANDWRIKKLYFVDWTQPTVDASKVTKQPWEIMQSNGMCIPKKMYNDLGGMFTGYRYHPGACDTDLCAHAFYRGYELMIIPEAICYHLYHKENFDDEYSTKLKEERIKMYENMATRQ